MNLRFVETFVWVVRLGGVTRAAEKLNLTQSAVSSRIAALEAELGTMLLDRRSQGFRLTAAGGRFLAYADRFLDLRQALQAELGAPERQPFVFRVGAIESILHTWLVPMANALKDDNPLIEFEMTVEMTPVLNAYLKRGVLDLVFSGAPVSGEGLTSRALEPMEMVFVGPAAMAGSGRLGFPELLANDLMTFQRGSQPHVALTERLRVEGAASPRVHGLSSISALAQLAEGAFGLATLPLAVARRLEARYAIAILDCAFPLAPLPVYASYRNEADSTALVRAVDGALNFAARAGAG